MRTDFYPRPPRGGRRDRQGKDDPDDDFYPRPPRGGRRGSRRQGTGNPAISIHALREEGDRLPLRREAWQADFYPRPPRGGRLDGVEVMDDVKIFLSTPSARRATRCSGNHCSMDEISIHALREEGDPFRQARGPRLTVFLSTPSARRATNIIYARIDELDISIHALREEGDKSVRRLSPLPVYFYPRPPRGGRLKLLAVCREVDKISIHALREEGDSGRLCPFARL